jgi:protein phosphatase 1G
MGNELDKPILDKNSYDEESKYIKFGLSSLQGWKTQMEDYNFYSIDIIPNSDKNIDIFGIMDGHRGPEVAKYISTHFIETLLSNNSFKEDNYLESLQETFLQVDKNLKTDQAQKELIKISEELKLNEEKETISIKQLYKPEDNLNEKEIEQIKYIKDILNPNNLINCNIPSYSGCSGIVILVTNNIIYIANAGDCRCIPLNEKYEVITDKSNKLHLINNDNEKKGYKTH